MVDSALVHELVAVLPGAINDSTPERLIFSVRGRGFAWTFMQRDTPKQKRWPNRDVLAVSCPLDHKELLIEAAPDIFFDDAHYRGYPAVLVRLPAISADELANLLARAHAMQLNKPLKPKRPRQDT